MAQKTAVEWLVNQLIFKQEYEHLPNNYILMSDKDIDNIIEQAKQMEREQHGLFLHWFVKHYETATIDGMFGFVDAMGKEVTVKEIVDHYYNETYGSGLQNETN